MEDPEAPAAVGNVVVRLADQIGMTPAGLIENGWRIAEQGEPASREVNTPGTRPAPGADRARGAAVVTGAGTAPGRAA